ncbi:hypothetical protein ACO0LO_10315 [Undibacterium sp. TJN25]|uniref:hypothetical protein n=1 Tax=Undibacterium sp. TJN25 TaxID=3413056 RepID=UPI003BF444ED
MDRKYVPVSCDVYDEILSLATSRKTCEVVVTSSIGKTERFRGAIADVFSRDGVEYIELSQGEIVRLDRIQALDGYLPKQNPIVNYAFRIGEALLPAMAVLIIFLYFYTEI